MTKSLVKPNDKLREINIPADNSRIKCRQNTTHFSTQIDLKNDYFKQLKKLTTSA